MSRFFLSVTVIVFPFGKYTIFFILRSMYHSVIPCVCVDRSYGSLSGGLLRFCHEARSCPGRKAWGLVSNTSRACCLWWQDGDEVFFSRVCKIRYLFCLENRFMSRSFLSATVIVFPYGKDTMYSSFEVCIIV